MCVTYISVDKLLLLPPRRNSQRIARASYFDERANQLSLYNIVKYLSPASQTWVCACEYLSVCVRWRVSRAQLQQVLYNV